MIQTPNNHIKLQGDAFLVVGILVNSANMKLSYFVKTSLPQKNSQVTLDVKHRSS